MAAVSATLVERAAGHTVYGYETEHATELAVRRDIDLHQALRLVRSGCAPELALAILL